MGSLLDILTNQVFSGIPSNAAWDLLKFAWEKATEKSWEKLYLESFQLAVDDMIPQLSRYADGEIQLSQDTLDRTLRQDLHIIVDEKSLSALTDQQFANRLAVALAQQQALIIGGHNLTETDYAQLMYNLVEHAKGLFRRSVIKHEIAFRQAVLTETQDNLSAVREVQAYLATNFGLVLDKLDVLEQKADVHGKQLDRIEAGLQAIREKLELDRSQDDVSREIQSRVEAARRGPMFDKGGLCGGYLWEPRSNHYYISQEFNPDSEDLRSAVSEALSKFGLGSIRADDFFWGGPILCKISALIQSTRFGIYQLTANQNRNVYLELGIAMGLGSPFVLVKDREAEIAPLTQGLDHFPVHSYLELRYELGEKVQRFLADIAKYRLRKLPPAGSERTAVIAHGNTEAIDFSVTAAKILAKYKLTPVILEDTTGKIASFLEREGIDYRVIGNSGTHRLDQTVNAIQSARLGVYRIDQQAAPDTFITLGISIALNRPGVLVYKSTDEPPSDLRGLNALQFASYTELEHSFPKRFDGLFSLYV